MQLKINHHKGFPKPSSILVIHWKDSQNSLRVMILMVIVYYGEKLQIKSVREEALNVSPLRQDALHSCSLWATAHGVLLRERFA